MRGSPQGGNPGSCPSKSHQVCWQCVGRPGASGCALLQWKLAGQVIFQVIFSRHSVPQVPSRLVPSLSFSLIVRAESGFVNGGSKESAGQGRPHAMAAHRFGGVPARGFIHPNGAEDTATMGEPPGDGSEAWPGWPVGSGGLVSRRGVRRFRQGFRPATGGLPDRRCCPAVSGRG